MAFVPHPLVLALFSSTAAASDAVRALHGIGIAREQISVVAPSHEAERALADAMDATPGVELEHSRVAQRLGELSGQVLAAIAIVLPGMGPVVTAGPLAAELGSAAGHAAGSLGSVLAGAGLPHPRAQAIQRAVEQGALLIGVHAGDAEVDRVRTTLEAARPLQFDVTTWS
jgi:hypothetical protein